MRLNRDKDSFLSALELGVKINTKTSRVESGQTDSTLPVQGEEIKTTPETILGVEQMAAFQATYEGYTEDENESNDEFIMDSDDDEEDSVDEFSMENDTDEEDSETFEDNEFNMGSDEDEDEENEFNMGFDGEEENEFNMDSDNDEENEFNMGSDEEENNEFNMGFEDEDDENEFNMDSDEDEENEFNMNTDEDEENEFNMGSDEDEEEFNMNTDEDEDDEFTMVHDEDDPLEDEVYNEYGSSVDNDTEMYKPETPTTFVTAPQTHKTHEVVIPVQQKETNIKSQETKTDSTNQIHVDSDVVHKAGMELVEFLRKNPTVRDEKTILTYYTREDLQRNIRQGKILLKKGRIII